MPQTQPAKITVRRREDFEELIRQLNYIFKDIYAWFDVVRGLEGKSVDNVSDHDHTAATAGGDYPWADITASQAAYLASLQAAITVTNLLDKTANEEISGTWKLTGLTASRLLALNASKEIIISALVNWVAGGVGITVDDDGDGTITVKVKQQAAIADASEANAVTDPADAPVDADALRDDLVANAIPDIESALNALGAKINAVIAALEAAEILQT